MARRYVRDNRGRFATTGATARGGRLRTASGNKRKAQTMKAATGEPKRGTIKRSTIKARRTEKAQASNAAQKPQAKRQRTRRPTAAESRAKGLTPISDIKARRAAESKASQAAGQSAYNRRYQSGRTKAAADAFRKSGVKGQKFSTIKNPAPEGSAPFRVTGSTYQGRKNAAAGRAARDAKPKRSPRAKTDLQAMQQADRIMSKLAKRQKAAVDNASSLESGLRGIRRNNARAGVVNRSLQSRGLLGKYNRLTAPADPIRMTPAGKGIPKPRVSSVRKQATNRLKLRTAAKRRLIADRGSVIPAQPKARRIRAQRPASTVAKPRTKGNDPRTVARRVDRKVAVNQVNLRNMNRYGNVPDPRQYNRAIKRSLTLKRAQDFTKTGKLPGRDNSIRAQRERRAASQRLAAKNAERKAASANKISVSPRRLSKDQQIARDVMTDKRFRSDRQRRAEMIKRGIKADSDFVGLVAGVRAKQGGGTTSRIKPAARQRGDSASVNVPMRGSRGRRLDAEITRNVTQQRTTKRAESRARNAQFKSDQSRAKALRGKYGDQLAKDFAKKSGRKVSEVKATIKGMAPAQQIKLLTKAGREQRAQANLARTADTRNKPGSTMIRRPSQKMTRGNLRAERALEFYKDPKKALRSVNKTRRGFRMPRPMR